MATEPVASKQKCTEKLRRQAKRRSQFWPGSGFALLGYPGLAALGTAIMALLPAAFLGLAFAFRPFWIWAIIASLVAYLWFYISEQLLCRSIPIYPGGDARFVSRFFIPVCAAAYVSVLAVVVASAFNLGSMWMGGSGMSPTLLPGDLLLYQRRVFRDDLRPGHLVFFRTSPDSAWGKGGDLVGGRILAIPGQELSIEDNHYLVDGKRTVAVSPLGRYRPSLEIPQSPQTLTVPPGSYFIVQDDTQNAFDSRVLSWAKEPNLIATRAIALSGHAFASELE